MKVADLQSWAKCADCHTIIWCEQSVHCQKCFCTCGQLCLHNANSSGAKDPLFTEEDMQEVLDEEYR